MASSSEHAASSANRALTSARSASRASASTTNAWGVLRRKRLRVPEYQGRSVGSRIMKELLFSLPVWRILLVADANAGPFYERLGFESFGDVLARIDRTKLYDTR